jgi:hypothetical protein
MVRNNRRAAVLLLGLAALLLAGTALAASSSYDLSWWTIGGGGRSVSGSTALDGAIGQPVAGQVGQGSLVLSSGYLARPADVPQAYLPMILE